MALLTGEGALGGLGLSSSPLAGGLTLATVPATSTLHYIVAGQSNATRRSPANLFDTLDPALAGLQATVNLIESALASTGFESGLGDWTPEASLGDSLANALAAAATISDSYFAPVIWWQGTRDSSNNLWADDYLEQLTNLKRAIELRAGVNLPWIIIRLNSGVGNVGTTVVRNAQQSLVASDSDVYLIDIDDVPLDGVHYFASGYATIDQRIRDFIDNNSLIRTVAEATTGAPTAIEGEDSAAFDSTFDGTANQSVELIPHTAGNISMIDGNFQMDSSGNNLVRDTSVGIGNFGALGVSTPDVQGEVTRIFVLNFIAPNTTVGGVILRFNPADNTHLALFVRDTTSNTYRLFYYQDGVYTLVPGQAYGFSPNSGNNFNLRVEYSPNL
ncbi:MAG: sialate O-acetylesterase, partial [Cyanobacteria bacterium J06634_6]